MKETDARASLTLGDTKPGRFFNDPAALQKRIESATECFEQEIEETPISLVGKLYVHGITRFMALRVLELHDELEARIAALEQARTMRFVGPHDPSVRYAAGAVTQRSGSTWVALVETSDKPGDSSSWRRIGSDR